jgi:Rieske Fe-S protein
MERREFLRVLGAAGVTLGAGGCASALPLTVRPTGGTLRVPLDAHPELAGPGGSVRLRAEGDGRLVYLVVVEDGSLAALSPICTHQGCTVGIEGAVLVCPCHGSTYSREGAVLRGPATRALLRYPTRVEGGEVVVELGGIE